MDDRRSHDGRGAGEAERPSDLSKGDWKAVGKRVKDETKRDNLSIVAAGVAFYAMLALVPTLTAIVSIYGLVADPAQVQNQVDSISGAMPQAVRDILMSQLSQIASASGTALSLSLVGSILFALWSASKGTKALISGLNIAYDERETRGFFKLNAVALLLTLGAVVFVVLAVALLAAAPSVLGALGLGSTGAWIIGVARWPLLVFGLMVALSIAYRYGPDRDAPKWAWATWGSALAAGLWLLASLGFSLYVTNLGSFSETYGSLGAVIVLLMWLLITAWVVLLGAELNAEMEHQTQRDTTTGPEEPMGRRDAYVADTTPQES